jgi:DNA-binding protein HU-beta
LPGKGTRHERTILQAPKRAAGMGPNSPTGESVKIKASKKIAFRVAKDLKDAI